MIKGRILKIIQAALLAVLLTASFALPAAVVSPAPIVADSSYIIIGDSVTHADSTGTVIATPHTLTASGWVEVQFKLAKFDGDVDVTLGFNGTDYTKTVRMDSWGEYYVTKYRQEQQTVTRAFKPSKIVGNIPVSSKDVTGADIGDIALNDKYALVTYQGDVPEDQGQLLIAYKAFDGQRFTYDTKEMVNVSYQEQELTWKQIESEYSLDRSYLAKDGALQWYIANYDQSVVKDNWYKVRFWVDVPFNGLVPVAGKYNIVIKPSYTSIADAAVQGNIVELDPWYNVSWLYRKEITVSNASANYQTEVLIGYDSGDGGDVDCNSHCQTDFDDLVFTEADGTTVLYHYTESVTGTYLADTWVKNSATPETSMYMYYGNAGASSTSDGTNTFIEFEDFEWGSDGDPITDSGGSITWSVGGAYPTYIDDGYDIGDESGFFGTRSAYIYSPSAYSYMTFPLTAAEDYAVRTRWRKGNSASAGWGHGDGSTYIVTRHHTTEALEYYDGASYQSTGDSPSYNAWHLFEYNDFDWTGQTVDIYYDGALTEDDADVSYSNSSATDIFRFNGYDDVWYDNIFVRKWSSTEQTFSSFGSEEENATTPTVTTDAADDIEDTTATLNGTVTDDAGETIDYYGFVWDTSDKGDPGDSDPSTPPGTWSYGWKSTSGDYGENPFDHAVTGLPTGTTIHFRAAAHNTNGWAYGSDASFLTKPAAPTNVAATDGTHTDKVVVTWTKSTGATNYRVYQDGGDVSGLLGDVATYDDTDADAPTINPGTTVASDAASTSYVTLLVSGESASNGTTHTYKVVASNATGNSDDSTTDTGYRGTTSLTYQWMRSNADADAGYSNIGGATTDPYNDTAAPDPTITAGSAAATDGTYSAYVQLTIAGESANEGAGRYYKCTVSMSGAASDNSTADRGNKDVGSLTYQWLRSAADSDAAYSTLAGATTDPYDDTTGVVDPDGRYYKCTLSATGAASDNTTSDRGYRAAWQAPVCTTGLCTGFGSDWAIVNGLYTDEGDDSVTQVGIDYGLTDAYGSSVVNSLGIFTENITYVTNLTGLNPATVYHYRFKAYNGSWGYGSDATFSTIGSPVLYESFTTAADNVTQVYGNNWAAQTFTTGTTAHTVTSVWLNLYRVGSPGDLTVSLTHESSNVPTGDDLCLGTIDGDALTTDTSGIWYKVEMAATADGTTALYASTEYAIVARATDGDGSNYVGWRYVAAGGYADGNAATSSNAGTSWTAQSWDYLFQIWGDASISIDDAKVFNGYLEDDDWLITVRYSNFYPPYYDTYDVQRYFDLQLTDGTNTLASSPVKQWGYRAGSIYLSAAQAIALDIGGTYYVRIYGKFGSNPYAEYTIQDSDWMGTDLTRLDSWVITSASSIGDYYDTIFTTYISGRGEVLNNEGGVLMDTGIPGLSGVRPDIFQTYTTNVVYDSETHTQAGALALSNWQEHIGESGVTAFTRAGNVLGIDGGAFLSGVFLLLSFVCAAIAFKPGASTPALVFSMIPLVGGVAFGVSMVIIGVLALVAAFLAFKVFYLDKLG